MPIITHTLNRVPVNEIFIKQNSPEPIDLATILFTQMQTETTIQAFGEAIEILKKYPKQYKSFKEQVEQMFKNLSRLKETI